MARRQVKQIVRAGDLDPETPITVGEDEEPTPVAPPGSVGYEVWEGHYGEHRSWPPTTRVNSWIGKRSTAEAYVTQHEESNAAHLLRSPSASRKYYVVVEITIARKLIGIFDVE